MSAGRAFALQATTLQFMTLTNLNVRGFINLRSYNFSTKEFEDLRFDLSTAWLVTNELPELIFGVDDEMNRENTRTAIVAQGDNGFKVYLVGLPMFDLIEMMNIAAANFG